MMDNPSLKVVMPNLCMKAQVSHGELVSWYPANNIDINIGLFNVFNRDYWHYSSVQGYEPDSPAISGLKSAERHLALNFALNF